MQNDVAKIDLSGIVEPLREVAAAMLDDISSRGSHDDTAIGAIAARPRY